MLRTAGCEVRRVGFNAGDRMFWPDKSNYIAFRDTLEAWPARFSALFEDHAVTDIVLYGDTRPITTVRMPLMKVR